MMVPTCDRCGATHVQLVPCFGKDICNRCVESVRVFLDTPPPRRGNRMDRSEQAMALARKRGIVNAEAFAEVTGQARRPAYFTLISLAKRGLLEHRGRGLFVLPLAESAELERQAATPAAPHEP